MLALAKKTNIAESCIAFPLFNERVIANVAYLHRVAKQAAIVLLQNQHISTKCLVIKYVFFKKVYIYHTMT